MVVLHNCNLRIFNTLIIFIVNVDSISSILLLLSANGDYSALFLLELLISGCYVVVIVSLMSFLNADFSLSYHFGSVCCFNHLFYIMKLQCAKMLIVCLFSANCFYSALSNAINNYCNMFLCHKQH